MRSSKGVVTMKKRWLSPRFLVLGMLPLLVHWTTEQDIRNDILKVLRTYSVATAESPTPETIKLVPLSFSTMGPVRPSSAYSRLRLVIEDLGRKTYVPYVWGGSGLGSVKECVACTRCAAERGLPAGSDSGRALFCPACRKCGIDCSNFVSRIFQDAELRYKFATTSELIRMPRGRLLFEYQLMERSRDLREVQTGDLLVLSKHVVMVVKKDVLEDTIDYIHSSRGTNPSLAGGIEIVRSMRMESMESSVLRILRHRDLHQEFIPPQEEILAGAGGSSLSVWGS